jgi:hypothetical protein
MITHRVLRSNFKHLLPSRDDLIPFPVFPTATGTSCLLLGLTIRQTARGGCSHDFHCEDAVRCQCHLMMRCE